MHSMRLNRVFLILTVFLGLGPGLFFASSDSSLPRVAYHPEGDFTRVVLDAPLTTKFTPSPVGQRLSVRLEPFKTADRRGVNATPQLTGWHLEPSGAAAVLTLDTAVKLGAGRGFRVFTLPAGDGLPNRVVIDLGGALRAQPLSSTVASKSVATPAVLSKPVSSKPISGKPTSSDAVPGAKAPKRPKMTVVLDPGHGGIDPGAVGFVIEKTVTLDVGLKVRAALQAAGVTVIMTRSGDYAEQRSGSLEEKRRDLDWRANMGSTDRNAFVSIHVNSAASAGAQGVETYLFGRSPDAETLAQAQRENGGGSIGKAITTEARNIARDLLNDQLAQLNSSFSRRLANGVQVNLISQTSAHNLGVKQAEFWVIRKPRIPAILVEIGFANHPVEGRNLGTQAYRQNVAQGIARGILRFLGL